MGALRPTFNWRNESEKKSKQPLRNIILWIVRNKIPSWKKQQANRCSLLWIAEHTHNTHIRHARRPSLSTHSNTATTTSTISATKTIQFWIRNGSSQKQTNIAQREQQAALAAAASTAATHIQINWNGPSENRHTYLFSFQIILCAHCRRLFLSLFLFLFWEELIHSHLPHLHE